MYQLFKGYVTTKDKKCTMPFKGKTSDELLNLRDVSKLPEYAGILNDNTILIDIDDFDQSEIMMQIVEDKQLACRVYETTRGKHFLFKNEDRQQNNWIKGTLACGLKSDGKLGSKTSYSILKYKGKDRICPYQAAAHAGAEDQRPDHADSQGCRLGLLGGNGMKLAQLSHFILLFGKIGFPDFLHLLLLLGGVGIFEGMIIHS